MTGEEYFDSIRNRHTVYLYEGRECIVTSQYRALYGPRRGERRYGSRYIVRFRDGRCENIPAGKFNKAARAA